MRRLLCAILLAAAVVPAHAQEVSLAYQVKAGYLFNFVKYVEWRGNGPLLICIAGHNPFGDVLADTIRGEAVGNRPLQSRVILEPDETCDVIFIPEGANAGPYLRAASVTPTLTVGETPDFIEQGGLINFFVENDNVRFEIDADAASRAGLTISSRLLRLGRMPERTTP